MVMKDKSISTAHRIKETIEAFESERIFSTQILLRIVDFGSRNAIDLILSRLVKEKIIIRLARGIFVKKEASSDKITPYMVAEAKAKAFGKTIHITGESAAFKVGMISSIEENINTTLREEETIAGTIDTSTSTRTRTRTRTSTSTSTNSNTNLNALEAQAETIYTFYTSGSSSSFKHGNSTIRFKSASHRRRELPDDVSGMVLKAVWRFGRSNAVRSKVKARYIAFNQKKDKLKEFRNYIRTLPKWIVKNLYPAIA